MSEASVHGKVHLIEETKTYGQNGFRKRLVVLEQENDRFTNYIPLDFIRDSCDQVDQMNVGDDVEVKYRLSGRRWQKDPSSEVKFFLNAEAISFQVHDSNANEGATGGGVAGERAGENNATVNDAFTDASSEEAPF
ncbi:MAG: DUF3127 domain-containing protein [Pirellulales bacterium]